MLLRTKPLLTEKSVEISTNGWNTLGAKTKKKSAEVLHGCHHFLRQSIQTLVWQCGVNKFYDKTYVIFI